MLSQFGINSADMSSKWDPSPSWLTSNKCQELRAKLKQFLEHDALFGDLKGFGATRTAEFKVAVVGRQKSGKTSTIYNLCGIQTKDSRYLATSGLAEYNAYWLLKLKSGGVPFTVRLRLWDAGALCMGDQKTRRKTLGRFSRMQASNADAVIYVCSATSSLSFHQIRTQILENSYPIPLPKIRTVIMTQTDMWVRKEVCTRELRSLESECKVRTFGISNLPLNRYPYEKRDTTILLDWLCGELLKTKFEI
ncbi:hypothetical protein AAMO2058_001349800 [Amorphochlora amoebiformis]